MARRRRPSSTSSHATANGPGRRGLPLPIANRLRLSDLSLLRVTPVSRPVTPVQDRRRHYPDTGVMRKEFRRPHIPVSTNLAHRRLVIDPTGPLKQIPRLVVPKKVRLCVRRKVRKEVILASGKGGGNHRKPRRNEYSSVRC